MRASSVIKATILTIHPNAFIDSLFSLQRLATMNVNKKETIQLTCLGIGMVSGLVLLGSLGVKGKPNTTNTITGLIGWVSLACVLFMEVVTLMRNNDLHLEDIQSGLVQWEGLGPRLQSDRKFNSGALSEEMTLGGLL